jgi:light-regulated signal transduction histidine kinase (bacteriophytochrome)
LDEDLKKANIYKRDFTEIPTHDLIHYVFAISNKAEVLVTRDDHFNALPQEKIKIRKPEEL